MNIFIRIIWTPDREMLVHQKQQTVSKICNRDLIREDLLNHWILCCFTERAISKWGVLSELGWMCECETDQWRDTHDVWHCWKQVYERLPLLGFNSLEMLPIVDLSPFYSADHSAFPKQWALIFISGWWDVWVFNFNRWIFRTIRRKL